MTAHHTPTPLVKQLSLAEWITCKIQGW